jgi:patatin-like phospholipase/acyl hydrolase
MRILSLDGGGYLGLTTATFIEEIERHFHTSFHERFDLFCGTSTGAIIALGLAAGMSGQEIAILYQRFGAEVFRNAFPGSRLLRTIRAILIARYSNKALRKALTEQFGTMTLGDLRQKNKFVLITAFSITNGTPRVFKTNHAKELTRDDNYLIRDVALASAAAPVYLPVINLRSPTGGVEERYCDGGVFANHPALLGYAEAVSHLKIPPSEVQILSLSTPRANLAERASVRNVVQQFLLSRGIISWGTRLASVMIDGTSMIAHQILLRIMASQSGTSAYYERIEFQRPGGLDMDVATARATETLRQIGFELACSTPIRDRLALFFYDS